MIIVEIKSLESACSIITKILSKNNADISYALIYLIDHKLTARLISTTFDENGRRFPDYFPETHEVIDLSKDYNESHEYIELKRRETYSFLKCDSWPIHLLIKNSEHIKVLLKDESQAVLLLKKITLAGEQKLSAILIFGVNRLRPPDKQYMKFLHVCKIYYYYYYYYICKTLLLTSVLML